MLTTKAQYYEQAIDPENEQLLSPSLKVVRTDALPAKLMRKLGIGDIGMRTVWHHWRKLVQLHKEKKIDLILIPVPPNVPMVLGRLANLRYGIPYVVDYIDPWVTEYYWQLERKQRPPKWLLSYALARCLEPFALRRARHITGVSLGTTDQVVSRYPWLAPGDATEIPYGAEADDFEYLRQHPRQNKIFDPADGKTHVCYVGAYVESMEQTLRAIFAAIRRGRERDSHVFEKLVLHFVGTTYATNGSDPFRVTAVARACGVAELITEHPERVSYLDSLQLMLDSHALVLLGSAEPHYTASKVFPYVLARRPLVAVFHEDSSVVSILKDVSGEDVLTFNSQAGPASLGEQISRKIENIVTGSEDLQPSVNWEALAPYTTKAMTQRLARALDQALLPANGPRV